MFMGLKGKTAEGRRDMQHMKKLRKGEFTSKESLWKRDEIVQLNT